MMVVAVMMMCPSECCQSLGSIYTSVIIFEESRNT